MISFETNFVLAQVTQLNNVLLVPVPICEFKKIIECLKFNGRSRTVGKGVVPRLNCRSRCHRNKPDDFFLAPLLLGSQNSTNSLLQYRHSNTGTKTFAKKAKTFLTSISQHNEFHNSICEICGLNQRSYKETDIRR
jgi:hypothetical protein